MTPRPRRRVHPEFREAYLRAIHIRGIDGLTLSLQAGFTRQTGLSAAMNRDSPASPAAALRLQRVAEAIGYEGPLWMEEGA
jgi:hypothetical protein